MTNQQRISDLKAGDYIRFVWPYGTFGKEIIITDITEVYKDSVLVHFLYGHKSESQFVKKDDIVLIADNEKGNVEIVGWYGKYILVKDVPEIEYKNKKQ